MATDPQTSPEQRAALRARYAPEPVPRCPHCGSKRAVSWESAPRLQMQLFRCRTSECVERRPDTDTLASTGDADVLAALDDADALAGALAETARLRAALDSIGARVNRWYWDDPDASALEAIDDVERIARAALAPQSGAEQDVPAGAPRMPQGGMEGQTTATRAGTPSRGTVAPKSKEV